jgi:hypothetical protein
MQQIEMHWKWARNLPSHSCVEGTTQIRRTVVWRETSERKSGLDLSRHRAWLAMLSPSSSFESPIAIKAAEAFLGAWRNALFSSGFDSAATLIAERHVLTAVKLPFAPSLWRAPPPWQPSSSALRGAPAAQNVAEQIGAHNGPITTASSVTIATIAAAQRFFRENFVSLFTPLIRYLLQLSRSTRFAEFGFHGAYNFARSQYPWPSFSTATFPANERYTYVKYPAASIMPSAHQTTPTFNP